MVRLPQYIGIEIREMIDRYRKINNISEPDEVKKLYNKCEQFLEEELYYITSLKVSSDIISCIMYFPNLTEIIIDSEKELKQDEITSIINMYPNLKSLIICEQNNLHTLDVSSLSNLETLKIVSNRSLTSISGIEELKKLYFLKIYDNPSLDDISIKTLVEKTYKIINEFKSNYCNIDVLYMPEFMNYLNRNGISIDSVKDYLKWSEHIKSGVEMKQNDINYTTGELYPAYKIATNIVNKYTKVTDSPKQKYAILYEWMCSNVIYDDDGRKSIKRMYTLNGIAQGKPLGTNGTVNAFTEGSCVCQGYTKAMQFLLKLCNITSFDISCKTKPISEKEKKRIIIEDGKQHADISDHSIIRVNLDGENIYSDVTWDANLYQKGYKRMYFLLSKEDMSKDHKLFGQDKIESAIESVSEQEFKELINFAKDRIKNVDKELEDEKNMTERLKQLKEEYDKIEKQISSLERFSKEHAVINYQAKLNNLTKQRDDILKLMNELMEQLKKKDSTKVQSHGDVINQVEKLLGISIKPNGNKTTLLQDKIRVYKQLEQLYKDGKIDIRTYTQMKKEVIIEYDDMIAVAPVEERAQEEVHYNIHEGQMSRFNEIANRMRQQSEQSMRENAENTETIENRRRIM